MKIIAGSIVRNDKDFIEPMIKSASWVDHHFIVDDHSTDGTSELLKEIKLKYKHITLLEPWFEGTMLNINEYSKREVSREKDIRNSFLDLLYKEKADAIVLIDSDELMSCNLMQIIKQAIESSNDAVALECNHLLNIENRIKIYEQEWNGVKMIDPHVRILIGRKNYIPGEWADSPDCFINYTKNTFCSADPNHFHMKYWIGRNQKNYALKDLPTQISLDINDSFVDNFQIKIPEDISSIIKTYFK